MEFKATQLGSNKGQKGNWLWENWSTQFLGKLKRRGVRVFREGRFSGDGCGVAIMFMKNYYQYCNLQTLNEEFKKFSYK